SPMTYSLSIKDKLALVNANTLRLANMNTYRTLDRETAEIFISKDDRCIAEYMQTHNLSNLIVTVRSAVVTKISLIKFSMIKKLKIQCPVSSRVKISLPNDENQLAAIEIIGSGVIVLSGNLDNLEKMSTNGVAAIFAPPPKLTELYIS